MPSGLEGFLLMGSGRWRSRLPDRQLGSEPTPFTYHGLRLANRKNLLL